MKTDKNGFNKTKHNIDHMCDELENRKPDESDDAKPLTVGKLIERLSHYEPNAKVVAYTKCGPDPIGGVGTDGSGGVCLKGISPVCEHLVDGGCTKI